MAASVEAGDESDHSHAPIVVRSRPVIERVPVQVINPVDVAMTTAADTLVADSLGNFVFLVRADGNTSLLGQHLQGLSRIVDSPQLGVHVLLTESGRGQIVRISDTGVQTPVAYLPFQPTGFGIDLNGNLLTYDSASRRVIRIDAEGGQAPLATLSESATDLVVDKLGNAVVLLSSGKLVTVFSDGASRTSGYVPASATRLKMHPEDFVVALAADNDGRPLLVKRSDDRDTVLPFAGTPRGTVAFAFDELGNLTLANPDLRAITRATSRFRVACPHCGHLVPMILSPDAPVPGPQNRRSF